MEDEKINEVKPEETKPADKEAKTSEKKKAKPPIVILSIAGAIVLVIGLVFLLLKLWEGSSEFYIDTSLDTETETDDRVTFLPTEIKRTNDDGVTTIVIFGNDTFGDSSKGPSVVKLLQENSTATIIDCTLPGSTLTAEKKDPPAETGYQMDYFCMYWLWECVMNHDLSWQKGAISELEGIDRDLYRDRIKTLESLDFDTVDYMLIAYDGHDYVKGHHSNISGLEYSPACVNGVVYGIYEKVFYHYPEIQVAFVAPTFCYARDENGNRVGGDLYKIKDDTLTSGILVMKESTQFYGLSYVDDYFGVAINAETAEKYLTDDDIVPNQEGKKLIAAHIINQVLKRVETEKDGDK